MIKRVLIANRGEIALRIMRTLRRMCIETVALYTTVEREDLFVRSADQALPLGDGTLQQTWLNIPLIIDAARKAQCDAIHPGYGFLSENAAFARACEQAGIVFIGPRSEIIAQMGSKTLAADIARQVDIPLLPRIKGSVEHLIQHGAALGFPLLVKAVAGGGGKGMIRVDDPAQLAESVRTAAAQALRYFADDQVYLEKFIAEPRHLEVQVLGDQDGHIIHLMERECTLQRHHQKVVEEAPSLSLTPAKRAELHRCALALAQKVGYTSAGTVEFILDQDQQFYFLEMNTRIQVEHPVSELITGIDIVEQQIRIANGEPLLISQDQVKSRGHAIELRLYAEDPADGYKPSAGKIHRLHIPMRAGLRIDSAIEQQGMVHAAFDAMIAKIIVHAPTRPQAIKQLQEVLDETLIHGIRHNGILLKNILQDPGYIRNEISTMSIARNLDRWAQAYPDPQAYPLVAGLFLWLVRYQPRQGAWRQAAHDRLKINQKEVVLFSHPVGARIIRLHMDGQKHEIEVVRIERENIYVLWNNITMSLVYSLHHHDSVFVVGGESYHVHLPEILPSPRQQEAGQVHKVPELKSSVFGRIVRINIAEQQEVQKGDPLLVLESMKMENTLVSPAQGRISRIKVKEGENVADGQVLLTFDYP